MVTAATDPRKDSRVVPGPSRASPSTAPSLKYESRPMADSTSAAALAVPVPTSADIERAKKFTREEFVYDGEPREAVGAAQPAQQDAEDVGVNRRSTKRWIGHAPAWIVLK